MKLTINSRKLEKEVTFSIPGKSYIFVDLNGGEGTMGSQICEGGACSGSTISYEGGSQDEFNRICRNWFRSYMRKNDN